jgi:TPP-dependent pyruvate/acetoin dehydrogenase alpha subunit
VSGEAGSPYGPLHPEPETPRERLAATTLPAERQLELYRFLQLNRRLEDRLTNLYRQGKVVGGLYSSRGQEAVSVGTAYALGPRDVIGPLIRNLGALLVRGVAPREILTQYLARATSPTGGRDCNLHFGDLTRGIVSPISMLGALVPVMAGVALAAKYRGEDFVAMTWIGDGGTSTGDFHEGMNVAAALDVPLVVVGENNGYAYSTPTARQTRLRDLAQRAAAYGIPAAIADGNDVLAVYEATRAAVGRARSGGGPQFLEVKTFRMKGHAEHDDASYVPPEVVAAWRARDPIERFERHLVGSGLASSAHLAEIVEALDRELTADVDFALESPWPAPDSALGGAYEEGGE